MEQERLIRLVTAAQGGDSEAMNELFNACYNDVYYFALKTVKNEEIACDITQETFVVVITSLKELKQPGAFLAWIRQITYSQCTRYFRKKKDVQAEEDEDGNSVFDLMAEERAEFIPDEALDQEDFRKTILGMLDELSEEQRAATMLYYYDELSVKQIAQIQGVSEGTVKSRLNYARKSIKASVDSYEKKNGVKLHCAGVLPLLLWIFAGAEDAVMSVSAAETVAVGVTASTGTAIAVSGTASGTAVVAAGAGVAAKAGTLPVIVEIIAGAAAALLIAGGVAIAALPNAPSPTPTEFVQPPSATAGTLSTTPIVTPPFVTEPSVTGPFATEPSHTEPPVTEPYITEPSHTDPPTTEPQATEPPVTEPAVTEPSITDPPANVNYVPTGTTYVMADGTVLQPGEAMPETISEGDQLVTTDFTYEYGTEYGAPSIYAEDFEGWGVACNEKKASYEPILSEINGAPVISMNNTFANNTLLTVAPEIPDTVADLTQTFYQCTSLTEAPRLPSSAANVYGTFNGCTALTEAPAIPDGVKDISYAFYGCEQLLAAPVIPEGVTRMLHTFNECFALVAASDIPDSVTDMEGAFYRCESLKTTPMIGSGVTDMTHAFYRCNSLTTVQMLPASVKTLKYAFAECYALTTVPEIPASVTDMYAAFDNCQSLKVAPVINEGVVDMSYTFQDCISLTQASAIPGTVQDMSFTFANCTSLTTAPAIPAGVTDLDSTFLNCSSLTGTVQINAVLEDYQACNGTGCYKCSVQGYECQSCPTCSTYADCFAGTTNAIILTGSGNKLEELAATSSSENITVE